MRTMQADYDAMAKEYKGNWQKFESFCWHGAPQNADEYALVYTSNRDSGALDRANAKAIGEALAPFIGKHVIEESHSHWGCGYIDGYAIRVSVRGKLTKAFRTYCDLKARLDDYPVLDDELFSAEEAADQEESWKNWASRDFERGIEKRWNSDFTIPADKLSEIFNDCADKANVYWEDGSINVERVVEVVTADTIREYAAKKSVRIICDGQYLCNGSITLDEYTADIGMLYDAEFAACMAADDQGEESVSIGGKVYTWQII